MQIKSIKVNEDDYIIEFSKEAKKELIDLLNNIDIKHKQKIKKYAIDLIENYRLLSYIQDIECKLMYKDNFNKVKESILIFENQENIKIYDKLLNICINSVDIGLKEATHIMLEID